MFRCGGCQGKVGKGIAQTRVPVSQVPVTYTDSKGKVIAKGQEIVSEVALCPECAQVDVKPRGLAFLSHGFEETPAAKIKLTLGYMVLEKAFAKASKEKDDPRPVWAERSKRAEADFQAAAKILQAYADRGGKITF